MNDSSGPRGPADHTLLYFLEDPVAVISAKGLVVYMNPAFERRFRASLEKAYGRPLIEAVPEWLERPLLDQLGGMEPGGTSRHFWIKTGRENFRVSMSVILLRGLVAGATVHIWDATREVEAKRRNLDLFQIMLSDLAYPLEELTALLHNPGPAKDSVLRSAQSQAEQLQDGFKRFQDFGELLFGELRTEAVPFKPGRLINLSRKSLHPLADQKKVLLEEGTARELPMVLSDPALLNRVLGLVVDYMIRSVRARELVVLSAELALMKDGSPRLAYSITGTGVLGLEAEWVIRDNPLPPDFQALSDEKKRLLFRVMLAHRIVRAMGGDLTLAAHEQAGTTLTVRVPAQIFFGAPPES